MSAPEFQTAYDAAVMAFVSMSVRQLLRAEQEDPECGSVAVEVNPHGVEVTILDHDGYQIGGYSL